MKKKTKIEAEYKLYILMRTDIPSMNAGKAMAQAAHAANSLTAEWSHLPEVSEYSNRSHQFGTTIVLAVDKKTLLYKLKRVQMREGTVPFGPVWDTTYPFNTSSEIAELIPKSKLSAPPIFKEDGRVVLFRRELTCGYVFVRDGSTDQAELVGDLPLHP